MKFSALNPTNIFSDSSVALGGSSNTVTGSYNVLVNGSANTQFSGQYNTLLNGKYVNFGASGQNNTVVAGYQATFEDQITGAVIIADHETSVTNDTNHSLVISFGSGITFENGDVEFNGDNVSLNSHLYVQQDHTGIFSGDIDVQGDAYLSGDLTASGNGIFQNDVIVSGSLNVTGTTYFEDSVTFNALTDFTAEVNFEENVSFNGGLTLPELDDTIISGTLDVSGVSEFHSTVKANSSLNVSGAARFWTGVTLKDSSEAASYDWVTGGLNDNGDGLVQELGPSPVRTQTGSFKHWEAITNIGGYTVTEPYHITGSYIDLPVSGKFFRVYGIWHTGRNLI